MPFQPKIDIALLELASKSEAAARLLAQFLSRTATKAKQVSERLDEQALGIPAKGSFKAEVGEGLSPEQKQVAEQVVRKPIVTPSESFGEKVFPNFATRVEAKVAKGKPLAVAVGESRRAVLTDIGSGAIGALEKVTGQVAKRAAVPVFKGLKGLSTKLLDKFRGLPNEITVQQFNEIANKASKEGIRSADFEAVNSAVSKQVGGIDNALSGKQSQMKIDLSKVAKDVEKQLVPLTPTSVKSPRWSHIGEDFIGDGKYGEIVYQSPIKTSAGDVHFPTQPNPRARGMDERYTGKVEGAYFPNYFSHVRYEDLADGKTRKLMEVQSDLVQKGKITPEFGEAKSKLLSALEDNMTDFRAKFPSIDKKKIIEYIDNCL